MSGFEQLLILFRRATSLPQLPTTAVGLIKAIDTGEASAKNLEDIISRDPGVAASLIRMSDSGHAGNTVRSTIMRMGQKTVRSVAVSLAIQSLMGEGSDPLFDTYRFARHSAFVGFLARYLHARNRSKEGFSSRWVADEFFAAGLLHDLSIALLARVAPALYRVLAERARESESSIEAEFLRNFDTPLSTLGTAAAETWALPNVFKLAIEYSSSPFEAPDEKQAIQCLAYANALACRYGFTTETWKIEEIDTSLLEVEVGVPEEEIAQIIAFIDEQTKSYIPETKQAA